MVISCPCVARVALSPCRTRSALAGLLAQHVSQNRKNCSGLTKVSGCLSFVCSVSQFCCAHDLVPSISFVVVPRVTLRDSHGEIVHLSTYCVNTLEKDFQKIILESKQHPLPQSFGCVCTVFRVQLHQQKSAVLQPCRLCCCARSPEWVEYQPVGWRHQPDQIPHQGNGLDGWVF